MAIFVSYARRDQLKVQHLTARIRQLGQETWGDDHIKGGQLWWDQILRQIRSCDALLIAVSPASLDSTACTSERQYAEALGKPVLPVLVEPVELAELPSELAVLQMVDYIQPGETAAIMLASAVAALPAARPLPDPLPLPPPVPLSCLNDLHNQVNALRSSLDQQRDFMLRLRTELQVAEPDERDSIYALLIELARYPDLHSDLQRVCQELEPPVTPDPSPAAVLNASPRTSDSPITDTGTNKSYLIASGVAFIVAVPIFLIIFLVSHLLGLDKGGSANCYSAVGFVICQ